VLLISRLLKIIVHNLSLNKFNSVHAFSVTLFAGIVSYIIIKFHGTNLVIFLEKFLMINKIETG